MRPFYNTYEVTIILKDTRREGLLSLFLINNRFLVKTKTETKPVVLRGVTEPECSVGGGSGTKREINLDKTQSPFFKIGHRKYRSIQHVNTYRETTEPFMSIPLAQFPI